MRSAPLVLLAVLLLSALLPAHLWATDLVAEKTLLTEGSVAVGDTVRFEITVRNDKISFAIDTGVELFDRFPAGLEWVGIEGDFGVADCQSVDTGEEATDGFDCTFDIAAQEVKTAVVTFVARAAGEQVNAFSVNTLVGEIDASDNEAQASVTVARVPAPILGIELAADEVDVEAGRMFSYTVTVSNTGDLAAEGVTVRNEWMSGTLALTGHTAAVPCSVQMGGTFGGELICDVGTLAAGASQTIALTFRGFRARLTTTSATASAQNHPDATDEQQFDIFPSQAGMALYLLVGATAAHEKHQADYDVYVDSVLVTGGLAAGATSVVPDFALPSLVPQVHVAPAGGALDDAVLVEQVDLFTGTLEGDDFDLAEAFVFMLAGARAAPTLLVQREARLEAQDPGQVDVFVAHAAEGVGVVSLRRFDSDEVIAEGLAFGELTPYLTLTPQPYAFAVVDSDGETVDVFEVDLTSSQGEALALVVVPAEGGKQSSVRLLAIDAAGAILETPVVTSISDPAADRPRRFALHGNHPNPFNPATTLRFDLPEPAAVRVEVLDLLGRVVLTKPPQPVAAGAGQTLRLDASALASGVYLYRLTAERAARTHVATGQLVLIR